MGLPESSSYSAPNQMELTWNSPHARGSRTSRSSSSRFHWSIDPLIHWLLGSLTRQMNESIILLQVGSPVQHQCDRPLTSPSLHLASIELMLLVFNAHNSLEDFMHSSKIPAIARSGS